MKKLQARACAIAALAVASLVAPAGAQQRFDLVEATVGSIQAAIDGGLITPEQLVQMYLARIAAYDKSGPAVNAYIHVNANAAMQARDLDTLRRTGIAHGPLFGIPVLLKDNVDTFDMPTTAGSVALRGSIPPNGHVRCPDTCAARTREVTGHVG